MLSDFSLILASLLLLVSGGLYLQILCEHHSSTAIPTQKIRRALRPRTPHDCPACRDHAPRRTHHRGRPKQIPTNGFACPNPECRYHRVTRADLHALVGYGHHGRQEPIQDLCYQACGTKFSARRFTPLYRLKTASAKVAQVLTALAEGLDVSAAVRVFGYSENTIRSWLTRAGLHADALHARPLQHLSLFHIQLDELRTSLRNQRHSAWLWLAIDPAPNYSLC